MKNVILGLAASVCLVLTTSAFGQEGTREISRSPVEGLGIEAGGSLLGLYVAPSYDISDKLQVRAVLTTGSQSTTQSIDGTAVAGTLSTGSTSLMLDYYPLGNGFRISGGLTSGGYKMTADVNNLTLGGVSFTGTTLGLTFAEKNATAPVVSVGFEGGFAGVAIVSDFGLRLNSLSLSATGQENLGNTAQFNSELAQFNNELSNVSVLPIFSIGASYSF